jgi:hypothetical protein
MHADVGLILYFPEVDTSRNPWHRSAQVKFNSLFDIVTDFICDWGQYDGCTNLDECTTVPRGLLLVSPTLFRSLVAMKKIFSLAMLLSGSTDGNDCSCDIVGVYLTSEFAI